MSESETSPERFSGWRIVALATITMTLTGPGQTIGVSVFVDHFEDDLDLRAGWVSAAYMVGTLLGSSAMPAVGRWIDSHGVRRSMTVIAVLFSLALAGMAGVQGIVSLTIGFMFIRMLGQGSLSLVSTVAVSLWFERRRGMALGVFMTASSALMAVVPVALNAAIGEVGWRGAWLIAAGVVASIVTPIGWFAMIDRPSDVGQVPDGTRGTEVGRASPVWGVDRSTALASSSFWVLAAAVGSMSMFSTALNFHQISLLGESGFSSSVAAAMFLPQVLGSSLGAPSMGLALDRVGTRYAPALQLAMLSGVLVLAGTVSSAAMVIVYATAHGIVGGAARTLFAALVPRWFGVTHLGAIQGSLTLVSVFASALGPFAFALTQSVSGSLRASALWWAIVPALAAVLAASHQPPHLRPRTPDPVPGTSVPGTGVPGTSHAR